MIKHRALPRRLPRALPCSEDYFFSGATSWGSSAGRAGTPSSQDLERLKLSATVNPPPRGARGVLGSSKASQRAGGFLPGGADVLFPKHPEMGKRWG